jgi:hypothetical protein
MCSFPKAWLGFSKAPKASSTVQTVFWNSHALRETTLVGVGCLAGMCLTMMKAGLWMTIPWSQNTVHVTKNPTIKSAIGLPTAMQRFAHKVNSWQPQLGNSENVCEDHLCTHAHEEATSTTQCPCSKSNLRDQLRRILCHQGLCTYPLHCCDVNIGHPPNPSTRGSYNIFEPTSFTQPTGLLSYSHKWYNSEAPQEGQ